MTRRSASEEFRRRTREILSEADIAAAAHEQNEAFLEYRDACERVHEIHDAVGAPSGLLVTTVVTRRSGCGCLTLLAAVVVVFGPIAWFPLPLAVIAYAITAVLLIWWRRQLEQQV
jgi:Flp pilus assembly protein TadB